MGLQIHRLLQTSSAWEGIFQGFLTDFVEIHAGSRYDDRAGYPGTIIDSITVSGAMHSWWTMNSPVNVNSVSFSVLTSGMKYWLIASAPNTDTFALWRMNSIAMNGPRVLQGGDFHSWFVSTDTMAAFRIDGTAVLEPESLLLLGIGLSALGLAVWRRNE